LDTIEYNGEVYRRTKTKWVDSRNLVVYDGLQNILNQLYLKTLDYSNYSIDELLAEGDKLKESNSYSSAIRFYEKCGLVPQKTIMEMIL
jgi:hypothetical protein